MAIIKKAPCKATEVPDLFADVSCHCFVYNVFKLLFQMSFSLHSVVKIFFFYAMRSRKGMWSCVSTFFIFFVIYLFIYLFIYYRAIFYKIAHKSVVG